MLALLDQTREPLVATDEEALIAREAVARLRPVADAEADVRIRVVEQADVVVPLPAVAVRAILRILEAMAQRKPVSVIPLDAELTTQQAADMLNVSRPHLVKLLEGGAMAFRKVGTHRRIRVGDLFAYREQAAGERRAAIDEMVRQTEEIGLE